MLEELKAEVCQANLDLVTYRLVMFTWGNVSGINEDRTLVVIKPSGVSYETMQPDDMVVVSVESGEVVEGHLRPSSDTPTHLELYRAFDTVGGITHTHSTVAASFAQAGMDIPALGTTHADYFYGSVPCTRSLTQDEVESAYELNTGKVIVEAFADRELDPVAVPGVVVRNHGPFTWGKDAAASVFHAAVLEQVADMAQRTLALDRESVLPGYVLEKHYSRKHGANAYYGQKSQ